ncbi:MAG: hypothetical protein QXM27_01115 [Candidatus Pacearchaeota archaeon]
MKEKELKEGDVVLCTVKEIGKSQVFLIIDKYNKIGVMQFSEVAAGRIRNIRKYVSVNKKVVCKVLRILPDGHIDLSLRRVSMKEREEVMKEYKLNKDAENLLKVILKNDFEKIRDNILNKYESFHEFLLKFKENKNIAKEVGIKQKQIEEIEEEIKKRIKEKIVKKNYVLLLTTYDANGIKKIKDIFKKIIDEGVTIKYISPPRYELILEGKNYEEIEKKFIEIKNKIDKEKNNFEILEIKEKI